MNSDGVITYTDFYGVSWSYDPATETFSGEATQPDGTVTEEWSYDLIGNTVYTNNMAGTTWTSDPVGGENFTNSNTGEIVTTTPFSDSTGAP